ncbi:MAG: acyl--CoA ligase [Solirubrobacteraceae bacterium]|nr:acyl--CoA ligase [Solirubrobacteraceae bacterium]
MTNAILLDWRRALQAAPDALLLLRPGAPATTRALLSVLAAGAASRLAGAGLPQGALVVYSAPNGSAFLAGLIALWERGLVPALADGGAPDEELLSVARGLGAAAVVRCAEPWPASLAEPGALAVRTVVAPHAARAAAVQAELSDAVAVKLSSGTTGDPKGVLASGAALIADDDQLTRSMGLVAEDRIVAAVPLSHSYGLSSVALPALRRGTPLIFPGTDGLFAALDAARQFDATFLPTVPAFISALVELGSPPPWPPSLRLVITAGASLAPAAARRFRAIYGRGVHTFYGASECGGIAFDRRGDAAERGMIGTAVDGVTIELAPEDDAPEGAGRVVVRSPAVTSGYLPEPGPRLRAGVFRTGDWGRLVEGELQLAGRADAWINVRGKKVDPAEVERILAAMPGVDEVVVLALRDPATGTERVAAAIGTRAELSWNAVRAYCVERLAAHKAPRAIAFFEALPRSTRGKLDRRAILARFADRAGAPGPDA